MENASKALIIAGTILISILLITVGLTIFKSTSGMSDQVSSSSESMAVSSFNYHFMSYLGDSVSGAEAREFVSDVIRNNSDSKNPKLLINLYDKNNKLIITGHRSTVGDLQTISNKISVSSKYKIYLTATCTESGTEGGYRNGYLRCISIKSKN